MSRLRSVGVVTPPFNMVRRPHAFSGVGEGAYGALKKVAVTPHRSITSLQHLIYKNFASYSISRMKFSNLHDFFPA